MPEPNNSNFNEAIAFLLKHEGGWANDPDDAGGATNFGISWVFQQKNLAKYGITSPEQLRRMSKSQAAQFYKNEFWNRFGINRIKDSKVATKLLDASAGFENITQMLGGIDRINQMEPSEAIRLIASTQRDLFQDSIRRHPRNANYEQGWMRRAAESPTGEYYDFDEQSGDSTKDECDLFFDNLYICDGTMKSLAAYNFNFGPAVSGNKEVDRVQQFSGWLRKEFHVS